MAHGEVTRRELVQGGPALGATAFASKPLVAQAMGNAVARPKRCAAKLTDIDHIVILMQENRSFDQYFGTFPNVRGFDDQRNRSSFRQPAYHGPGSRNGHLLPFHFNGLKPDHLPPPLPEPGTDGEFLTTRNLPPEAGGIRGPVGLRFRVPCIVISPWSRGGLVSSKTFDHTSVLRLIESRFGVEVPNLSDV